MHHIKAKNIAKQLVVLMICLTMIIPIHAEATLPTIGQIVGDFKTVFGQEPTHDEQEYWKSRRADKGTREALKGAMSFHKANGQTMPGGSIGAVLSINQIVELFQEVFGNSPSHAEQEYWKGRRKDKPTMTALRGAMHFRKAKNQTMPGKTAGAVATIPSIGQIVSLFNHVFGHFPSHAEQEYWKGRRIDKPSIAALEGAMYYQKASGQTMDRQGKKDTEQLIRDVLPVFVKIYNSSPSIVEKDWWRRRIRCNEITSYKGLVSSMSYHKSQNARLGSSAICGQEGLVIKGKVNGLESHPMGPHIRVGLHSTNGSAIVVTSNGSFQVREGHNTILRTFSKGQQVSISWANGKYHIQGPGINTTTTADVRLVPLNMAIMELVGFSDNSNITPFPNGEYNKFRGIIEIRKCRSYSNSSRTFTCNLGSHGSNSLWAINELRVEYYLRGLAETSGNGPVEYLKALGTAARTYALYHAIVTGGRYPAEGFDITNTPSDQIYRGYGYEALTGRMTGIFADTKGVVITNGKGTLAVPVYFSDSDGRTRIFPDPAPRFSHLHHSVLDPYSQGRACGVGGNHCYGMSAQGAYGFVSQEGWSYERVLNYYYKGIQLVQGY